MREKQKGTDASKAEELLWFNHRRQLSNMQLLAHCPFTMVGRGGE